MNLHSGVKKKNKHFWTDQSSGRGANMHKTSKRCKAGAERGEKGTQTESRDADVKRQEANADGRGLNKTSQVWFGLNQFNSLM